MTWKPALHIQAIVVDIPARCETVREAAADLRLDKMQMRMFHRLFGLDRLPRDPGLSLQTLLGNVLGRLSGAAPNAVARATHLLHCHTIPHVRIAPHGIEPLLSDKVEYMSLTMAHCASGLVGLRVLEDLIPDGLTGILVIGEKAFHRRVRLIEDTTIMSDGAVAMVVGREPGRWRLMGHHATQAGATAIQRGHPMEPAKPVDDYPGFVARHINEALTRFGRSVDDLKLVLPHNVNAVSWVAIAKLLGLARQKIHLRTISQFGHCFGADPFLNLLDAEAETDLRVGDLLLAVSVGMGMSAAASLIKVCPHPVSRSHQLTTPLKKVMKLCR